MRIVTQILFFLAFFSTANAQTADVVIERVIKIKPREIPKYQPKPAANVVFLQTGFNDAVYRDQQLLQQLKGKVVLKIELVYTTYHASETFDQHGLNRKRLKALLAAAPNVLDQPGIEWVLLAQTACTSAEMGQTFFHGVAITTRPAASEALVDTEIAFLEAVAAGKVPSYAYEAFLKNELKPDSTGTETAPAKEPKVRMPDFVGGERARVDYFTRNLRYPKAAARSSAEQVIVQFVVDRDGKITNIVFPDVLSPTPFHEEVLNFMRAMPDWRPGTIDGKRIDCMVTLPIDFLDRGSIIPGPMEVYAMNAPLPKKAPVFDYTRVKLTPQSKMVSETLAKNGWKHAALVCDITASMAPYTAQVLDWLRNQFAAKDTAVVRFVLFNDGDNKKNSSKRVGSTGGLYSFVPQSFDEVLVQLAAGMKAGSGGDLEENDIEALLQAEADCPQCESTILIADNIATPRDLALIPRLTKPVHVIVCGASPVLNEAYLNLARATKGTVHFNNKDYANLHSYEDGATVQVAKEIFVLVNGKFVRKK